MSNFTLSDVIKMVEGGDMESLMGHMDEILEFAEQVDSVAADLLRSKPTEYSLGLVSTVNAVASMAYMRNGGNLTKVLKFQLDEDISNFVTLIIKMTVGLCVMEELR